MTTELLVAAERVHAATDYLDVFGKCEGDKSDQKRHIKKIYRPLARILHPDKNPNPADNQIASDAFPVLERLFNEADKAIDEGIFGQRRVLATVSSRKGRHVIRRVLATGDLCTLYVSESTLGAATRPTICKIAKKANDRDLLEVEAKAIKRLRGPGTNEKAHPYVPELLDSFMYFERGKPQRRANVFGSIEGLYTLDELRQAFGGPLDPQEMTWIWRRLLVALDHAHRNKVVHGAVLPSHILIHPGQRGLVLIDWCYASIGDDDGKYQPIKAIVDAYKDWYPAEVLNKTSPSQATDLAMAARCMVHLMGGNPVNGNLPPNSVPLVFRGFFKSCLTSSQTMRPQDAFELREDFDALLEQLGEPYYPRRFRPLVMPTGVTSRS